jgi:hypothetical protein
MKTDIPIPGISSSGKRLRLKKAEYVLTVGYDVILIKFATVDLLSVTDERGD